MYTKIPKVVRTFYQVLISYPEQHKQCPEKRSHSPKKCYLRMDRFRLQRHQAAPQNNRAFTNFPEAHSPHPYVRWKTPPPKSKNCQSGLSADGYPPTVFGLKPCGSPRRRRRRRHGREIPFPLVLCLSHLTPNSNATLHFVAGLVTSPPVQWFIY